MKMKEKIIIRIKGHLNENWKDWFDGVEISYEGDITVLTCENKDQAYVHGILNQIRDQARRVKRLVKAAEEGKAGGEADGVDGIVRGAVASYHLLLCLNQGYKILVIPHIGTIE